jgi:hypothetical protein
MRTFNVYECDRGRWVYWITVHAYSRGQAEAVVRGSNPPRRFRIEEVQRLPR